MNMFKPTSAKTPEEYIANIEEPRKSEISRLFTIIQQTLPAEKPFIMAGMIGFVPYHYKYASGREGDWAVVGLANQKNYISIYVCTTDGTQYVAEKYKTQLGKVNVGKSCIRFKKVDDVDIATLKRVILEGVAMTKKYGLAM